MSEGRVAWHHVGNRILGNPFTSLGLEWCQRCKMEVDTNTEATHRGGVYLYKRWCDRCGLVIKRGQYQVPLLSDRPLPAAALAWTTEPGKDRR